MRSVTFATPPLFLRLSPLCAESPPIQPQQLPTFFLPLLDHTHFCPSARIPQVRYIALIYPPWSAKIPSLKLAQMSRSVQAAHLSPRSIHTTLYPLIPPNPTYNPHPLTKVISSTQTASKKKPRAPKQLSNPKKPKQTAQ